MSMTLYHKGYAVGLALKHMLFFNIWSSVLFIMIRIMVLDKFSPLVMRVTYAFCYILMLNSPLYFVQLRNLFGDIDTDLSLLGSADMRA
ncbi:hypothetical protein RHGRI_022813 [Rhododendron griersonianum]|uniref:Uncharacterized protein n=1 Tax=Rhododendron griersonianum TaxID=479676 RepID=A0AAV6J2D2_9ERIC|nr:hypothetical protein RHGRI_022813 [Rhododendron griersonianum]